MLRQPLADLFADAEFLAALAPVKNQVDPLAEDWGWVRGPMQTLLRLAQAFTGKFSERKRADGVLDFHDLEQFALRLLWDFPAGKATRVAENWRQKLRFVFVDEYQDINAAQDKIIAALAGEGAAANRFLVGDVKQSIYRFRLADPKIFRAYAQAWPAGNGQVIALTENFRSRESLLDFVNAFFGQFMREEAGGVVYDARARLAFGAPETRAGLSAAKDLQPRTELLLRFADAGNDLAGKEAGELAEMGELEKEARLLAARLRQLHAAREEIWDEARRSFRAVEWRDMAVLLRAMSGRSEIYAMEFERAGVPVVIARGGFYESAEISDLLSLLELLDNPLQDIPCLAVLRSPLAGFSLEELATIRLTVPRAHFWTALVRSGQPEAGVAKETHEKIKLFLERFARWRQMARQTSLSRCLEQVLVETHYNDWLKSRPRGGQRHGNVGRFLKLAEKFDQFQRQGLFRFLKFITAQRAAGAEPEVAPSADENAVRLMSIHQSKGQEFPVVAVADLAKPFNTQDMRGEIIFDEEFGLCPKVKPPASARRYSSLPHWLAQRHQRRELAGEELRLLYVAMTRARDRLILTGSVPQKKWESLWAETGAVTPQKILEAKSYADWLGGWFAQQPGAGPATQGTWAQLCWRIADDAELAAMARIEPRPPANEWAEINPATTRHLHHLLTARYGFVAATQRAAKSSVTVLRRQAMTEMAEEAEPAFPFHPPKKLAPPDQNQEFAGCTLSAAAVGTAHHKFLQHLSLAGAMDIPGLKAEIRRMESRGILSGTEAAALDLSAVAAFWNSATGEKIRRHAAAVRRELAFTAKFSAAELTEIIGTAAAPDLKGEFVVVQGVADLVVRLPGEIWLVDFKTDAVRAAALAAKTKSYAPQLRLYARALEKIYDRPVTHCWLHFLTARWTEKMATR